MAKRSDPIDWKQVKEFAAAGARARLAAIREEMGKILAAFPQLGMEGGVPALPPRGTATKASRSRSMSPAERQAVSERMKKYWAAKRARATAEQATATPAEVQRPSSDPRTRTARAEKRTSGPRRDAPPRSRKGRKR